jgi:hypothetical protein
LALLATLALKKVGEPPKVLPSAVFITELPVSWEASMDMRLPLTESARAPSRILDQLFESVARACTIEGGRGYDSYGFRIIELEALGFPF